MNHALELWAGAECTVARVGDRYVDQNERTGHARRLEDLDRLAAIGARAIRQPILWERTTSFEWADARMHRLRALGLRPIVGLVHHGSGPPHTSLLDDSFVSGLAAYARSVAERYPWARDFTPVNEPLTTARFSALYGHWYPHARGDADFARALLVQCRAIRAAMRAIREVSPRARLVQTEDIGAVFATPRLAYQARFENQRRFLSLDLLAGRVTWEHPLFGWLVDCARVDPAELEELASDPCPPDVVGVNYYVTSDRFLDERIDRYPASSHGGNGRERYADVEAARVRGRGIAGHRAIVELVARRYGRPVAITEVHLGGPPEEQIRWLAEAWRAANDARAAGVDVRAVTAWSAFGAVDWDSLLVLDRGRYEPGLFDTRAPEPRRTALAIVARDLATRGASDHPLLASPGWWARDSRFAYPASGPAKPACAPRRPSPIVVTGGNGTLGRAIVRVCEARELEVVALSRDALDVTDAAAVARMLDALSPWAVVNAAGYVRVDDAEREPDACYRANTVASAILARACRERGARYATFSSDLVFDGRATRPYVESDPVGPLCVYGRTKAESERRVVAEHEEALIVRTSAFFGPWDEHNFVTRTLAALEVGARVQAASDAIVSPTYVPDLCHAVLSLLVDGASGVWHVANRGAVTWLDLARAAARHARVDDTRLESRTISELAAAPRPPFSALASERADLMPPLDDALARFTRATRRAV